MMSADPTQNTASMEEEDDPVEQEIPVFLSQALSKHLYIYQFPVKPANRDWDDVKIVNASVKPQNQLVRLEVGLDTYSDKYCSSKGEQIALNTDGYQESRYKKEKENERAPYFRDGIMDKIVYESSAPCTDSDRYAIAILQDKEMHCTPVHGIVQLRPSHSYFDRQDKRKQDKNKADNSEEEDEEPESQQVTVKFARQETDVAKRARELSYEHLSRRAGDEPWHAAMWRSADSDHADLERLKLFSADSSPGSALSLKGSDYTRALVPAPPPDEVGAASELAPLEQRVKDILKNARLISFTELISLTRTDAATLVPTLSATGVCVRGLWAPRSSDLYTQPAPPPPLLCGARDHVLYLFSQHPYIDRRKVAAAVRLPAAEVLEIIRSVARFNPRTGWELILPPDTEFESKYPDVIHRQNMYLEGRQRQFNEMMLNENVPKRQRKKSQRDSVSSDTMMSPKARCNSVSEEDSDVRKRKNKSATGLGKRTRNVSSSSAHDVT